MTESVIAKSLGRATDGTQLFAQGTLALPAWVAQIGAWGSAAPVCHVDEPQIRLDGIESGRFSIARVRLAGAATLDATQLEALTFRAYSEIFGRLHSRQDRRYPVRFWNFLPCIHEQMTDDGRDRYMVFNAGRFKAYEQCYGGRESFDVSVATASAVGHTGQDLLIYCLASDAPGAPLDNPRQIKPYRYSSRFGPLPPCFARATLVKADRTKLLLVGGTASIRGEDSAHVGDLKRQADETFENLAALVRAAGGFASDSDIASMLRRYRELRVYHPNRRDAGAIRQIISAAFPRLQRLEMRRADLCRGELLVEIEGIAELH